MLIYTPTEINTILYQIDCIEGIKVLVDYLHEHEHLYARYLAEWVEDIRLLMIMFK